MNIRIGIGNDFHCLDTGSGFRLGGIWIESEFTCIADSDGDVLLHALTDALLGSLALGDIGEWYPKVEPGELSTRFVQETMAKLLARRASVINVDCIIELERPKIGPWKMPIRQAIASLLRISIDNVNIKAKTREGQDAIGQSKGIAAQVVVLVALDGGGDA